MCNKNTYVDSQLGRPIPIVRGYNFSLYKTRSASEIQSFDGGIKGTEYTEQNYLVNMLDELAWKSSLMVRVKTKQRERKTKTVPVLAVRNT